MADSESYQTLKITLLGSSQSGKSNLLCRYSDNSFIEDYRPTIGVEFRSKPYDWKGKTIRVLIWDTAGQERYKAISASYMRGSHGSAIIFDLSRRESFDKVGSFIREIQESNNQDKPVILIGNKADLEGYRQISFEEAKQFADSIGASYAETSALTGFNVDDAFRLLISEAASKALLENP